MNGNASKRVVLDTYAVFAWLQGEAGEQRVDAIMRGGEPWMTLICLSVGVVPHTDVRDHLRRNGQGQEPQSLHPRGSRHHTGIRAQQA